MDGKNEDNSKKSVYACEVTVMGVGLGEMMLMMLLLRIVCCVDCGVVQNSSLRQCKQSVRGVTTNNHRRHLLRL